MRLAELSGLAHVEERDLGPVGEPGFERMRVDFGDHGHAILR
jgi:hypothetical protein